MELQTTLTPFSARNVGVSLSDRVRFRFQCALRNNGQHANTSKLRFPRQSPNLPQNKLKFYMTQDSEETANKLANIDKPWKPKPIFELAHAYHKITAFYSEIFNSLPKRPFSLLSRVSMFIGTRRIASVSKISNRTS